MSSPILAPNVTTVPMFDPQGQVRMIPQERVQDAINAQGKLAVRMTDPNGVERYIPHDKASAALQAGGKIVPDQPPGMWEQFKAMLPNAGDIFHAAGVPSKAPSALEAVKGVGNYVNPLGIANIAKSMVKEGGRAATGAAHTITHPSATPTEEELMTPVHAISALNPFAAPAVSSSTEAFQAGRPKEAIAGGIANAGMLTAGLVGGRLGGRITAPKPPTAGASTEALASFIDDRGGAVNPHSIASDIHPALKNQAALDKLDLSQLKGREVGQAVLKTVKNTVNAHQAEVATITKPYDNVMVDQSPIAEAYLNRRTPELIRNDPEAAARLMTEARKYADVDKSGNIIGAKPAPLSDVNALRIRLNNETAATQGKAEGAYRKTDWETQADVKAVEAAREVQYGNLAKVSGLDEQYIRSLQRREGQLMETRDSLTKEFNKVSGQQAEAVAGSLRANPPGSGRFLAAAREKIGHTYPSRHGAERTLLRETIAPDPIETFNNRLKLAFSNLGEGTPAPTYEQVPGAGAKPPIQPPTPPTQPSSVAGGRITPEHIASENAFYTQARSELGANASAPQVLQRAAQLKAQGGTTGGHAGGVVASEEELARPGLNYTVSPSGRLGYHGKAFAPEATPRGSSHVTVLPSGELRVNAGPKLSAQQESVLRQATASSRVSGANTPTLTQKVQAQPLPRLRQIQSPRNPSTTSTPVRSLGLAGPQRAQAIAATMTALKRGEITQREADRQIQRARGGGSGKLIRMPQNPG